MAEDISGLPDVDVTAVAEEIVKSQEQDKGEEKKEEELDLEQFKNPKDLLKSYKEIQGAFTRVTQENKGLKESIAEINERLSMSQAAPQTPPQADSNFDIDALMENPQGIITSEITKAVNLQRVTEVLEEEQEKEDFQERYAFAQMVARQYPHLAQTARGVRKLFKEGDKLRETQLKKSAGKALESIFGEPLGDEEITRLRTLVKGKKTTNNSDAYMPDTSTSTTTGADDDRKPDHDQIIKEAAEKGDVDGVLDALFASTLAE